VNLLFRYILREILVSSLIGAVLFTFVLFLSQIGPVMELLVRASVSPGEVGRLFLLTLPQSLPYTVPMGVLLGVLLGLGRLSSDGEIIAIRAAGIPARVVIAPVMAFCLGGAALSTYITTTASPWAAREFQVASEAMKISQATAMVQPRVFIEDFPDTVLYVRDVLPGPIAQWKGMFMADTRAPQDRGSVSGVQSGVNGPRITIAEEAQVVPLQAQDRLQLHLPSAFTYERSPDPKQYQIIEFKVSDQVIEATPDSFRSPNRPLEQLDMDELWEEASTGEQPIDAGILLHQRLALPFACLLLPLAGIPLAISSQRAGKSLGVVLAIVLAFAYWMTLLGGTALASEGILPPGPAMWLANVVFGIAGAFAAMRLDAPNRKDVLAILGDRVKAGYAAVTRRSRKPTDAAVNPATESSSPLDIGGVLDSFLPITDRYVLRTFLFYFGAMLAAFVSIWYVFSFFELLGDMLSRDKLAMFVPYVYYLTPFLAYETTPLAVLAATLISFGILSKNNEITAFRACGVSVYRLAAPVLLAALCFGAVLFTLDNYYLPEANRIQDSIRDEIKGRPARTFLRPDRQWTYGLRNRIFYHRFFDLDNNELAPIEVFDLSVEPFRLSRHISADRARWDPVQETWVFENGWIRNIDGSTVSHFEQFETQAFSDILETPAYFRKESKSHQQMNWSELQAYIADLTQSGFSTMQLQVMLHRKFSFPFFAFSMALLAVPFALLTGHRGALAPIAFSLALAIGFYALSELFEKLGQANQLSPVLAAWAPALIFSLSGIYLFLRVRS
jgi:LPS export ABC transporter permease LptG/LPS export ABC transporter permease LptF